uniref:L27 domain-containing protein n=1 Tax=Plectus sambesii TaxID=2011161 RepID=A0A914W065_9BILA
MPVRRTGEAHQALELLEEYHAGLTRPTDEELRSAIERVISVFKDRLFLALLDIQEFYEDTLLNDRKTQTQKTFETKRMAEQWENNPPFGIRRPPLAAEESGLTFIDTATRNGNTFSNITATTFNRQIETSQRTFQMVLCSFVLGSAFVIDLVAPLRYVGGCTRTMTRASVWWALSGL